MSKVERFGTRDLTYSAWHREQSTKRFVGIEKAQLLGLVDTDIPVWVEYGQIGRVPLALIETAVDVGQDIKPATVTANLARMAGLPAFTVLYTVAEEYNPANPLYRDISEFRVKRIDRDSGRWERMTPEQYAQFLLQIRSRQGAVIDLGLFEERLAK